MPILWLNFNFAQTFIITLILLTSAKHISSSLILHYVQFECPTGDFSYSSESTFEADLKHTLLDVLPSSAGSSNFVHMGEGIDEIYALFYCRGDVTAQVCHDCVQAAAWTALQHCSPLKEGIVWFDECTLYYSTRSAIFSPDQEEEEGPKYRNYNFSISSVLRSLDESQYQQVFNSTMEGLISEAAFGTGFATTETNLELSQSQSESQSSLTLRGLVQCSPHIVGGPCERCLRTAIKQMDGWATTMVFLPSCSLRFDLFPSQIKVTSLLSPASPGDGGSRRLRAIIPIGAACLLLLCIVVFLLRHFIGRIVYHYSPNGAQDHPRLREYTYWELAFATCFFFRGLRLGCGAFGPVYKGRLADGRKVAIKRLNFENSQQGDTEFLTEIATISRIDHANVVSLYGYCIHQDERMLVYKYVPNKTLHHHLHEGDKNLTWQTRMGIAIRLAEALAYLHDNTPAVIHRDIKPYNILMDFNFEPTIGDFGLAKLCPWYQTHMDTLVRGTEGYIDPYYFATRELTRESDVFAFGVVLLELITGRPSSFHHQETRQRMHIRDWAVPLIMEAIQAGNPIIRRRKFEALIDHTVGNDFMLYEADRMATCAAICVLSDRTMRPSMSLVVQVLRESDEHIIRELNARLKNFWHNRNQAQRSLMNIVQGVASSVHHLEIKLGEVEHV